MVHGLMRWSLLALPLMLGGCDPTVRFHVDITLPPGMKAAAEQLHLEAAFHEVKEGRALPATPPKLQPKAPTRVRIRDHGFGVDFSGGGVAFEVALWMRVWVDANGNGTLDSGDAEGWLSPKPFHGRDPGGCRSNVNETPPLQLTLVP